MIRNWITGARKFLLIAKYIKKYRKEGLRDFCMISTSNQLIIWPKSERGVKFLDGCNDIDPLEKLRINY